MAAKLPKWGVLYIYKKGNVHDSYICGKCPMFLEDLQRCEIHGPDDVILEEGTCGYWVAGEPKPGKNHTPMGSVTTVESGYEVPETGDGTSCKRCEYFIPSGECKIVEGSIDGDGCCARWEAK